MNILLETGIVIVFGFLFGEAAARIKLPKISGYILAGVLLNPHILKILSDDYTTNSTPLINISLSFITFSIGGSLSLKKIRASGKMILLTTVSEAMFAYIFVGILVFIAIYYFFGLFSSWSVCLAVSLVLASLASPTDPSATLAVQNEYHARGKVSSAILEIAAFDDITGIFLYTLTLSFVRLFLGASGTGILHSFAVLGKSIGGALLLGIVLGTLFNFITRILKKESEGSLIVIISGMLLLCYGIAAWAGFDELLSTMMMGAVVVNFNEQQKRIFTIIERYTDELIFVVFFTLSGLHLNLSAISGSILLIAVFVVARALGKYTGTYLATSWLNADEKVRKYTAGGLFPQGGIVIGLALLLAKNPLVSEYASLIIGVVIGASLIHELLGPLVAKAALKKAGEIK